LAGGSRVAKSGEAANADDLPLEALKRRPERGSTQTKNSVFAVWQTKERNTVMLSKKSLVMATLTVIGTGLLVFTTAGSKEQPDNKLEGAWVCTVQFPGMQRMQWTMMLAPTDPSGHAAVASGSIQVPVSPALLCPATGQASPPPYDFMISRDYMGEVVMTGPHTAQATFIGYTLNKEGQVAFIWMGTGESTFTAPGKGKAKSTLAYYLPETDTNGDGIPEGTPFCVLGPSEVDMTRVGVMPLPGL
jgi:hypothetical protein